MGLPAFGKTSEANSCATNYLYLYTVLIFCTYQSHLHTNAGIIAEIGNPHLGARSALVCY